MGVTSRINPETKTVTFDVFGRNFNFCVDSDDKSNYKLEHIIPILAESIVEVHWEHSRKDNKPVLLFYKKSPEHSWCVAFSFCVEADSELARLKNAEVAIPELLKYMFANRDKLNFNVPSSY